MKDTAYKQLIEEIAEGNKQLNAEDLPLLIDTYLDHNEEAFDNALVEWSDEIKTAYLQLLNGDHRLWNDLAHTFITKSLKDMISKDLEKKIDEIEEDEWQEKDSAAQDSAELMLDNKERARDMNLFLQRPY